MEIRTVTDPVEKQQIAQAVLVALPDWFGVPEERDKYVLESAGLPFFAAYDGDLPFGFLCLHETGKDTVEIRVMGVLKEYHRKGAGRQLFEAAREVAAQQGYSFLQVKTVQMGCYDDSIKATGSIVRWDSRSLRSFPCSGMRTIPARFM